jgi:hypothetical protein
MSYLNEKCMKYMIAYPLKIKIRYINRPKDMPYVYETYHNNILFDFSLKLIVKIKNNFNPLFFRGTMNFK